MLLGTVLSLRACDVVALKLTDIDWLRGEIHIVQTKTSNVSFENFRTMATECQEQGRSQQPVVYVTA